MHVVFFYPRRLTGVAALACATALTPVAAVAAVASPAAGDATASAPRCATAGLVVWMNTQGSAAAGSIFYTLEFTNLSGHACTLRGYPGVSAVSLGGRRLGRPAAWVPPGAPVVRLARGASAYAVLQYSDVVTSNSGPQPCDAATAAGLRVYPPDQTASKIVPFPLTACTRRGLVYMSVRPVQTTARRGRAVTRPGRGPRPRGAGKPRRRARRGESREERDRPHGPVPWPQSLALTLSMSG